MTTLITASTPDGVLATCDARCYNAQSGNCQCICGGINHGRGLGMALTYTKQLHRTIAKRIKTAFPETSQVDFFHPNIKILYGLCRQNPYTPLIQTPIEP